MTVAKRILLVSSVVFLFSASLMAQALEKRHQVGIRTGWWSQVTDTRTEISADGIVTSVGNDGLAGGVFYEHWLHEYLALDISIGGMVPNIEVSVGTSGVTSETATIGQILFGMKYYFPKSTYLTSVRPHARAGVGMFIGSVDRVEVGTVVAAESRSETALGGNLGAGVDFVLSKYFVLAVDAGYNFMTDFGEPIGGSKNYSGPQFNIGFGYVFGRGIN